MKIGELVERTGVSARTIRYYEELGILPPARRTERGTRRYRQEYLFYVEGVEAMKDFGFTLDELAEIGQWAFGRRSGPLPARTREVIATRVAGLEHRIEVLAQVRDVLAVAVAGGDVAEEPIHLAFAHASRRSGRS